MQTSGDPAVRDVAADPICAAVLMDEEQCDEEEDLQEHVGVDTAVADVGEGIGDMRSAVDAAEDFEAVGCDEKGAGEVCSGG